MPDAFDNMLRKLGDHVADAAGVELDWLRDLYDTHGSLDDEGARLALAVRTLDLVERAVPVVLADIEHTTPLHPDIRAVTDRFGASDSIGVAYDRASAWGWPWPFAQARVLVLLADIVRDHVVEDLWRAWPLCPHHGFALYPEIHGHEAIWDCKTHGHTVARIGELRPT